MAVQIDAVPRFGQDNEALMGQRGQFLERRPPLGNVKIVQLPFQCLTHDDAPRRMLRFC